MSVAAAYNEHLQRTVIPVGRARRRAAVATAILCIATACTREAPVSGPAAISNEQIEAHEFLECMDNEYFPRRLVDRGRQILLQLSARVEREQPADEAALYALTHAATRQFNDLAEEFYDADSEIESSAAECIALDFDFIARAYGFENADLEELIAPRDW